MSQVVANLTAQRDRFLAFVQRRTRNRAVAEDILQAAYGRAIEQEGVLKTSDSANAWFFRILRNSIIDHYRHRAVEDRTFTEWTPEADSRAVSIDEAPANLCGCMKGALTRLQPSYREILQEVELGGAPLHQYAQESGITPGSAGVRAHRARRALHQQLLHQCGSCAEGAGCLDCTCKTAAAHH